MSREKKINQKTDVRVKDEDAVKYKEIYDAIIEYERKIHIKNEKRIKIGLRCIIIIPMIFLFLLFVTESSKVIFLILWIVSLFVIASYLIAVEYMDYNLQKKIKEFTGDEDAEFDGLLGDDLMQVHETLKRIKQREGDM
ncbi:MAG: hypothetical protein IIV51_06125 [Lachnospiraceae bacterium]|nr:hypothetical protein [Lachnospiraceae bacterium]